MAQFSVHQLSADSTLAEVRTYEYRVAPSTPVREIYAHFQHDPTLPGTIVIDNDGGIFGMVSRQRCLEQLSHRFGAPLFMDAPVLKLVETLEKEYIAFPHTTGIHEAARRCLSRPREQVYEPAIVIEPNGEPELLSMYDLLLAQSHMLSLANETIQQQIGVVEAANRAKSDFLANMSHEIRTPLNAILGMTELLLDGELTARQREYISTVADSGETLLALINDILDFSKIEAGKLSLEATAFDAREQLGDAMRALAVRASRQGIELALHVAPAVPRVIEGDPVRLRQVLLNLVGNAIKFTEKGEVVVDVALVEQVGQQAKLHFKVRDTGIGIPESKLEAIFKAFEQADTSTTRKYGGTGLGLTISSRLVEMMGGRIWVESKLGQGSTFHFTARLGVGRPDSLPPPPDRSVVRDTRALVVDDHPTNRLIIEEQLGSWDMETQCVPGVGEALLALSSQALAGRPFELVITDAHMPERDGFDLAATIRAMAGIEKTPIIMLTSAARAEHADRCDDLGIAAYLMKPVKQSELFNAIVDALDRRPAGAAKAAAPSKMEPKLPRLRILLAEDSVVNRKLVVEMLTQRGQDLVTVGNGQEALELSAVERFDLILMDVQMPILDGFEATQAIRKRERETGAHVPIVAMTAHALKGDRERCLAAGMDEYVSKPIRASVLVTTIAGVAERFASGGARQRVDGAHGDEPQSEVVPEPSAQENAAAQNGGPSGIVDWNAARDGLEGDEMLLRIAAETFEQQCPRMLNDVQQAIAKEDAASLRIAAHTLKGAVRYFGPTPAYDTAFAIEELAKAGKVAEGAVLAPALLQQVGAVVADVHHFLQPAAEGAAKKPAAVAQS